MAQQTINVGSAADDGNGDRLRTAFTKVNSNFNELYSRYCFGSFAVASIQASALLMDHIVGVPTNLPANLAGTQVSVGTNPAATWTANVQKNGTNVGTISISTAGAVTMTTIGAVAVPLAAGDLVSVFAPASADASLARLRFTFVGSN